MARNGGKQRSKEQVLVDRAEMARRYLRGETLEKIGTELGFDRSTVGKELKAIRAQWLQSSLVDFNDAKARELAKIDHLEETYWDAWKRSIGQVKKTTQQAERLDANTLVPIRATVQTEESIGNPTYLQGVQWCIQKRLDIFGLEAPKQLKITERDQEISELLKEWTSIVAHEPAESPSVDTVH